MSELEWKNPPARLPRKVDIVAGQLLARPGEWALIEKGAPGIELLPWWGPLYSDERYELRFVRTDPRAGLFSSPKDIYARARTVATKEGTTDVDQ